MNISFDDVLVAREASVRDVDGVNVVLILIQNLGEVAGQEELREELCVLRVDNEGGGHVEAAAACAAKVGDLRVVTLKVCLDLSVRKNVRDAAKRDIERLDSK